MVPSLGTWTPRYQPAEINPLYPCEIAYKRSKNEDSQFHFFVLGWARTDLSTRELLSMNPMLRLRQTGPPIQLLFCWGSPRTSECDRWSSLRLEHRSWIPCVSSNLRRPYCCSSIRIQPHRHQCGKTRRGIVRPFLRTTLARHQMCARGRGSTEYCWCLPSIWGTSLSRRGHRHPSWLRGPVCRTQPPHELRDLWRTEQ